MSSDQPCNDFKTNKQNVISVIIAQYLFLMKYKKNKIRDNIEICIFNTRSRIVKRSSFLLRVLERILPEGNDFLVIFTVYLRVVIFNFNI